MVTDASHRGKLCKDDSGGRVTVACGIFRHFDGLEAIHHLEFTDAGRPDNTISYEFDFNCGYCTSEIEGVYSDILVGKNVIQFRSDSNSIGINFKIHTQNPWKIYPGDGFRFLLLATELNEVSIFLHTDVPTVGNPSSLGAETFTKSQLTPIYELKGQEDTKFYLYEINCSRNSSPWTLNNGIAFRILPHHDCEIASVIMIPDMPKRL